MNSSWSTEGGWFSKTTFYRSDFCPVTSSAHCYRACLRLTQQNTPKPNPLHSFDPVTSVAADSCLRQTEWEHNFTNMSHSCVSPLKDAPFSCSWELVWGVEITNFKRGSRWTWDHMMTHSRASVDLICNCCTCGRVIQHEPGLKEGFG